ncbi:MAG TPA: hypothetical protein VHQ21_01285 [Rhodanobacteraceae bacterium]|jgi:hypothetical protein|nr:hypothetical protein [Rhodanobacteraceae bacterium]
MNPTSFSITLKPMRSINIDLKDQLFVHERVDSIDRSAQRSLEQLQQNWIPTCAAMTAC